MVILARPTNSATTCRRLRIAGDCLHPISQAWVTADTPDEFSYDFDGYADFLDRFTRRLKVRKFAIYLHDFGSQIGLRLAIKRPDRIVALIFQNGDIYEDQLGPSTRL